MSEIERKLATVERIKEIRPIEGADNIELAFIRGWQCVTGKENNFKKNDLVLYFEIDSFLPVKPQFEFLRKNCFRSSADIGEGFRIKTIKLRGEISQGLIAPLSDFPEYFDYQIDNINDKIWYTNNEEYKELEEGMDVTELLGVKKWEIPLSPCLKGEMEGFFPSFIPKTDEERWQNLTYRDHLYHGDDTFEVSVKYDGSSMTAYSLYNQEIEELKVGVCSRNLELKETDQCLQWKLVHDIGLYGVFNELNMNIAFQGELCGPGIQKNPMKLKEPHFYVFNIYDIDDKRYYEATDRCNFIQFLKDHLGAKIDHVNFMQDLFYHIPTIEQLNEIISSYGNNIEGVVFKSVNDPSFSFKYINPQYLLKDKD